MSRKRLMSLGDVLRHCSTWCVRNVYRLVMFGLRIHTALQPPAPLHGRHTCSGDGVRLFAFRFGGTELREHASYRCEGVGLVMTEGLEVRLESVTGHLEFLVGETNDVHGIKF